jgi:hypothetical protein
MLSAEKKTKMDDDRFDSGSPAGSVDHCDQSGQYARRSGKPEHNLRQSIML